MCLNVCIFSFNATDIDFCFNIFLSLCSPINVRYTKYIRGKLNYCHKLPANVKIYVYIIKRKSINIFIGLKGITYIRPLLFDWFYLPFYSFHLFNWFDPFNLFFGGGGVYQLNWLYPLWWFYLLLVLPVFFCFSCFTQFYPVYWFICFLVWPFYWFDIFYYQFYWFYPLFFLNIILTVFLVFIHLIFYTVLRVFSKFFVLLVWSVLTSFVVLPALLVKLIFLLDPF